MAAALSIGRAQQTGPYDVVIANGRVIDPESGLDDVRHVGISVGNIPRTCPRLRTFIEDGGVRLKQLLSRLRAGGMSFRFPKVHPAEISKEFLETLGFRHAGGHLLYAATLRPGSGSP